MNKKVLPSLVKRKMMPLALAVIALGVGGMFLVMTQNNDRLSSMDIAQEASAIHGQPQIIAVKNTASIVEEGQDIETSQVGPEKVSAVSKPVQVVALENVYLAKSMTTGEYGALKQEVIDAVDSGMVSRITAIMADGNAINASDETGETALLKAAMNGDEHIGRVLLEMGADVLIASNNGTTPLVAASMSGNVSLVNLLLEAGSPTDAQMLDGRSALMVTAWSNFPEITSLLLEYGGNPNLVDKNKRNALFYALWDSNIEVTKLLLAAGADVGLTDNEGQSAVDIAKLREIDLASLSSQAGQ